MVLVITEATAAPDGTTRSRDSRRHRVGWWLDLERRWPQQPKRTEPPGLDSKPQDLIRSSPNKRLWKCCSSIRPLHARLYLLYVSLWAHRQPSTVNRRGMASAQIWVVNAQSRQGLAPWSSIPDTELLDLLSLKTLPRPSRSTDEKKVCSHEKGRSCRKPETRSAARFVHVWCPTRPALGKMRSCELHTKTYAHQIDWDMKSTSLL